MKIRQMTLMTKTAQKRNLYQQTITQELNIEQQTNKQTRVFNETVITDYISFPSALKNYRKKKYEDNNVWLRIKKMKKKMFFFLYFF